MILKKFLKFQTFEPRDSYKLVLTKNKCVEQVFWPLFHFWLVLVLNH